MQQWNYLLVVIAPAHGVVPQVHQWVVYYTHKQDQGAVNGDANDYLDFLGQQGWELVPSHPTGEALHTIGLCLTFRRPVAREISQGATSAPPAAHP